MIKITFENIIAIIVSEYRLAIKKCAISKTNTSQLIKTIANNNDTQQIFFQHIHYIIECFPII